MKDRRASVKKEKKQIGILGGTFDPVHCGHTALAVEARKQFALDEVWLMPSPDPPHKLDRSKSDFADRYRMTELAVSEIPGLICSDYETKLPQPSYTSNTLECLRRDYPDIAFYFLVGEDSLDKIETWHLPERIMELTTLIVAYRREESDERTVEEQAEYLRRKYHADIDILQWDGCDVSSTQIREMTAKGEDITGLVPEAVRNYIWNAKLYTKSETN